MKTNITKQNIKNLLTFLPFFESDAKKYSISPESFMDPYDYADPVNDFIHMVYSEAFILEGFDWPSWQDEAQKYIEDKTLIKEADIETIQKLLTTFIRKERFASGTIARLIDDEVFLYILYRLDAV
ncbi:hypothetical protein JOC85_003647 [Bacillus mesophilus]|uniref:Uncharacterized protein n=1 Tax=Bacillus mesophilus TaxID=1808955 RepID=A0A6M0QAQ2_9BACI|nr:DUF6508 domain-containing protein [Bacillus mesophilus]MBM7662836.1 hypothetical protein [Bacillus mesophilus]NEY73426.1 hypothetical protein [Bacillus mesophilus]